MAKSPFSVWLILDLFVNILTMLAVVQILSNSINGLMMVFITLLFFIWAFRPMILAIKEFFSK
jgi:hypothetical protein